MHRLHVKYACKIIDVVTGVTLWTGALAIQTTLEVAAGSIIKTESSTFGSSDDTVLTSVVNPGCEIPPLLTCTVIFASKSLFIQKKD